MPLALVVLDVHPLTVNGHTDLLEVLSIHKAYVKPSKIWPRALNLRFVFSDVEARGAKARVSLVQPDLDEIEIHLG